MNARITAETGHVNISPFGFHRYASEFAKWAREAHVETKGRFSPIPYYLYCHSLELVLKAFLLAKGVPMTELPDKRKLGHDLLKIFPRAKTLDLEKTVVLAPYWEPEIHKANVYYSEKGFEYFSVVAAAQGYPNLPALDVLNEIVTTLLAGLEQICIEA